MKKKLVDAVRHAVDHYPSVYVFSFENMRTTHFEQARKYFHDSR